jgi:hypothetical protein
VKHEAELAWSICVSHASKSRSLELNLQDCTPHPQKRDKHCFKMQSFKKRFWICSPGWPQFTTWLSLPSCSPLHTYCTCPCHFFFFFFWWHWGLACKAGALPLGPRLQPSLPLLAWGYLCLVFRRKSQIHLGLNPDFISMIMGYKLQT